MINFTEQQSSSVWESFPICDPDVISGTLISVRIHMYPGGLRLYTVPATWALNVIVWYYGIWCLVFLSRYWGAAAIYTQHSKQLCSPSGNSSVSPIAIALSKCLPGDIVLLRWQHSDSALSTWLPGDINPIINPTLTTFLCGQTSVITSPILPRWQWADYHRLIIALSCLVMSLS